MRTFETGATRDEEQDKLDYEGFLSPLVLERFAQYMHTHRVQVDGGLRDSDNWQRGIPFDAYMKSGFRHFMAWWKTHRFDEFPVEDPDAPEEALCALMFNVQGYLHEILKARHSATMASAVTARENHRLCRARLLALGGRSEGSALYGS